MRSYSTKQPARPTQQSNPNAALSTASHPDLPHLTPSGNVHMTSIASKLPTSRIATAQGTVYFTHPDTYPLLTESRIQKGDVLAAARLAGIMAAKRTPDIVPLCHPSIGISGIEIDLQLILPRPESSSSSSSRRRRRRSMHDGQRGERGCLRITASVASEGRTGVEMEAMTAVMGAALTVYDMCKAVDKGMVIGKVILLRKEGGKSGTWTREEYLKERLAEREEQKEAKVVRYLYSSEQETGDGDIALSQNEGEREDGNDDAEI
jgi:molybdenum cofactor biosynthesis enzyme